MKICRELCDKTGGARAPQIPCLHTLVITTILFYTRRTIHRHVRRRHERRALQRPPFRAHPPTGRPAKHRGRGRGQDERGPDDDGLPAAAARHGARRALRVPLADARRGVPLSALRRAPLRRADRLRHLRTHDRVVAPSRTELPSPVPRQTLLCRVSASLRFAQKLNEGPLFLQDDLPRSWVKRELSRVCAAF